MAKFFRLQIAIREVAEMLRFCKLCHEDVESCSRTLSTTAAAHIG